MGYPGPVHYIAYSLLPQNGFWAIPCVWIDPTTVYTSCSTPNFNVSQQPTLATPIVEQPGSQPSNSNGYPEHAHPFGPPPVVSDTLLQDLSDQDCHILMCTPLPFPQQPSLDSYDFGMPGGSALGLQFDVNGVALSPLGYHGGEGLAPGGAPSSTLPNFPTPTLMATHKSTTPDTLDSMGSYLPFGLVPFDLRQPDPSSSPAIPDAQPTIAMAPIPQIDHQSPGVPSPSELLIPPNCPSVPALHADTILAARAPAPLAAWDPVPLAARTLASRDLPPPQISPLSTPLVQLNSRSSLSARSRPATPFAGSRPPVLLAAPTSSHTHLSLSHSPLTGVHSHTAPASHASTPRAFQTRSSTPYQFPNVSPAIGRRSLPISMSNPQSTPGRTSAPSTPLSRSSLVLPPLRTTMSFNPASRLEMPSPRRTDGSVSPPQLPVASNPSPRCSSVPATPLQTIYTIDDVTNPTFGEPEQIKEWSD
ncbi:hypothetical protein BDV93DRAFT_562643 [Ceratobasidium sp. AG-I]|nr:hypothetical protein BDV93DRAFT_562643 [Ceratobasidium sp. AG-I]